MIPEPQEKNEHNLEALFIAPFVSYTEK